MEDLTPPILSAVREVRWRMTSGRSMNEALRAHLLESHSVFSQRLREWWALKSQDCLPKNHAHQFDSPYQRAFLELIERGCAGQPTLDHLTALEQEIELAAHAELESHVAALPFKVLIPLLVFQFPAFLILLLGPLLRELGQQLGQS